MNCKICIWHTISEHTKELRNLNHVMCLRWQHRDLEKIICTVRVGTHIMYSQYQYQCNSYICPNSKSRWKTQFPALGFRWYIYSRSIQFIRLAPRTPNDQSWHALISSNSSELWNSRYSGAMWAWALFKLWVLECHNHRPLIFDSGQSRAKCPAWPHTLLRQCHQTRHKISAIHYNISSKMQATWTHVTTKTLFHAIKKESYPVSNDKHWCNVNTHTL